MYQSCISLEVRILLPTGTKAFCPCLVGQETGLESCPVCRGQAEAAPRLNESAARLAYLASAALSCESIGAAKYERFTGTPAVPAEYALSRLSLLVGKNGRRELVFHRRKKRVRITEVRIEEHAGRLTHSGTAARMDYSSAGMPSLRIKTAADLEIGEEAEVFLKDLKTILLYLGIVTEANAERLIRCNAHVALIPIGDEPEHFVKLRNLNSFDFARKAINYELNRQEEIIQGGGTVISESRLWNEGSNRTESFQARSGEEKSKYLAVDHPAYRMPKALVESIKRSSIELPERRRDRITREYGVPFNLAAYICETRGRADFYEETVRLGADPIAAAHWVAYDVARVLNRLKLGLSGSVLKPEHLAGILGMLAKKKIHGKIARQVLAAVIEEKRPPEEIIKERHWEQITDKSEIEAFVDAALSEFPAESAKVRAGEAATMEFLIGRIMEKSHGLAEPSIVKSTLKNKLSFSFVYILSMGGQISGSVEANGTVIPGDEKILKGLLAGAGIPRPVRLETVPVRRILSEEITPEDWAALITLVAAKINSGTANGIVVTHGADTLAYTASLLFWLFADANVPIVLAASITPPGDEARETLKAAVELAAEKASGVYVVVGGKVYSPLNLKFERISKDGFRSWNLREPIFSGRGLVPGILEADHYILTQILEETMSKTCIVKVYPGMKSDFLIALMKAGARHFVLELYDSGTANLRESPYSLKDAFLYGRKRGVAFYCTSQQEGIVDFSGFVTSHALWKEGAVPMGALATESAFTKLLAASITAESDEELAAIMESE